MKISDLKSSERNPCFFTKCFFVCKAGEKSTSLIFINSQHKYQLGQIHNEWFWKLNPLVSQECLFEYQIVEEFKSQKHNFNRFSCLIHLKTTFWEVSWPTQNRCLMYVRSTMVQCFKRQSNGHAEMLLTTLITLQDISTKTQNRCFFTYTFYTYDLV